MGYRIVAGDRQIIDSIWVSGAVIFSMSLILRRFLRFALAQIIHSAGVSGAIRLASTEPVAILRRFVLRDFFLEGRRSYLIDSVRLSKLSFLRTLLISDILRPNS